MRISILVLLMLIVVSLLAGCYSMPQHQDNTSNTAYPEQTDVKENTLPPAADNAALASSESDEITPYQFLNLICANAETLSFTYSIAGAGTNTITFQKTGDKAVETYIANDMNENPVSVRELEKDGKVHYIMDDSKIIKTYSSPAEDFLLYRMMTAAKTVPDLASQNDEYSLYEHSLPFEHAESIQYKYRFYMMD